MNYSILILMSVCFSDHLFIYHVIPKSTITSALTVSRSRCLSDLRHCTVMGGLAQSSVSVRRLDFHPVVHLVHCMFNKIVFKDEF